MTVLGQHTAHEADDLLKSKTNDVDSLDRAYAAASPSWVSRDLAGFSAWSDKYQAMHARWDKAKAATAAKVANANSWTQGGSWDLSTAEDEYQELVAVSKLTQELYWSWPPSNPSIIEPPAPQPTANDFDHSLLMNSGAAIDAGAALAKQTGAAIGAGVAASKWYVLGGAALLGLLALAVVKR